MKFKGISIRYSKFRNANLDDLSYKKKNNEKKTKTSKKQTKKQTKNKLLQKEVVDDFPLDVPFQENGKSSKNMKTFHRSLEMKIVLNEIY